MVPADGEQIDGKWADKSNYRLQQDLEKEFNRDKIKQERVDEIRSMSAINAKQWPASILNPANRPPPPPPLDPYEVPDSS